jgi:cysteine-rich repeat protein
MFPRRWLPEAEAIMNTILNRAVTLSFGFLVLMVALAFLGDASAAPPPATVRVQGFVSDRSGGPSVPANGTFQMTFRLYDAAVAGTLVATSGPGLVQVTAGLYNTDVAFPPPSFNGGSLFLEVQIKAEILTPRIPVVSVPYAYLAAQSASVAPGGVGSASIAPGAVTPDKLAPCADGQALVHANGAWACVTVCHPGDALSCYDGPEPTVGVGTCHAGRRPCDPNGAGFGACLGQKLPSAEICDGIDDDCNGVVDDNCVGCGNGVIEAGETCDDGNRTAGDGCSATCQQESGYTCTGQPSICTPNCASGTADCDHLPANGCEANLNSPSSCGACGIVCDVTNANNATCNGQSCSYTCKSGFSDCNSVIPNTNGCECATPICCGNGCGTTHLNGLGQNFFDCAPLAVPGNAATYNSTLAAEARSAWPFSGNDQTLLCGSESGAARMTANSCALWIYTGPLAGHVHLNTAGAGCFCASASDPTWN